MADLLVDGGALLAGVVHGGAGLGVLGAALLLVLRGLGGDGHGAALTLRHGPALLLGLLLEDGLLHLLTHLLLHMLAHLIDAGAHLGHLEKNYETKHWQNQNYDRWYLSFVWTQHLL